jgi:hypothetical protein
MRAMAGVAIEGHIETHVNTADSTDVIRRLLALPVMVHRDPPQWWPRRRRASSSGDR